MVVAYLLQPSKKEVFLQEKRSIGILAILLIGVLALGGAALAHSCSITQLTPNMATSLCPSDTIVYDWSLNYCTQNYYKVEVWRTQEGTDPQVYNSGWIHNSTTMHTGLTLPSGQYYWRVTIASSSHDDYEDHEHSGTMSFTVACPTCPTCPTCEDCQPFKDRIVEMQTQMDGLNATIVQLELDLANCTDNCEQCASDLANVTVERDNLLLEIITLEGQLQTCGESLATCQAALRDCQARVANLTAISPCDCAAHGYPSPCVGLPGCTYTPTPATPASYVPPTPACLPPGRDCYAPTTTVTCPACPTCPVCTDTPCPIVTPEEVTVFVPRTVYEVNWLVTAIVGSLAALCLGALGYYAGSRKE